VADDTTRLIAAQCRELAAAPLPAAALAAARDRVLDTLGCAAGGQASLPARVACALAAQQSGSPAARVLGTSIATTPELAAFAGGVMARYLDYNDTYTGPSSGHPSDMIPALLALAEAHHRSGAELLGAVICGYEAFGAIGAHVAIRSRGWDQGVLVGVGAAAGAATLLRLDAEQFEHAIGLAATMAMPTRSTRAGALSMWKGCATAASARFGLFAAQLAAAGMTAPDRAIEGRDGLWQQVTGEFAVAPFGGSRDWVVTATAIKLFPVEYNAQIGVELMRELAPALAAEQVTAIEVGTYWTAYDEIGNEPEKWAPATRETADHSLPYLLAVTLADGGVTEHSFDDGHLADPAIRAVMARISVYEDEDFTRRWPGAAPCRLRVTTTSGRVLQAEADYPPGHPARPLDPAQVEAKFVRLGRPALGDAGVRRVLEELAGLDQCPDVARIVDLFDPAGTAPAGLAAPPGETVT
jgi:2-methylcitrate dehydratase